MQNFFRKIINYYMYANILGSSDWNRAILGLFGSPCLGVYRRKMSDRIGSLGREILAIKNWVRSSPHIYV